MKLVFYANAFTSLSRVHSMGSCHPVLHLYVGNLSPAFPSFLEITYEDLLQFISTFFNRIYVETLVYGNEDVEVSILVINSNVFLFNSDLRYLHPYCRVPLNTTR